MYDMYTVWFETIVRGGLFLSCYSFLKEMIFVMSYLSFDKYRLNEIYDVRPRECLPVWRDFFLNSFSKLIINE